MKGNLEKVWAFDRENPETLSYTLTRGSLNGLVMAFPNGSSGGDKITVKLRHDKGTSTLVPRMDTFVLAEISNVKNGFSIAGGSAFVNMVQAFREIHDGVDVSVFPAPAKALLDSQVDYIETKIILGLDMFKIDLGMMNLANAELEVTYEPKAIVGGGNQKIYLGSYLETLKPAVLNKYDISYDLEQKHSFVKEAFAFTQLTGVGSQFFYDSAAKTVLDLYFEIEADSRPVDLDTVLAIAQTAIFGKLELTSPLRVLQLYSETTPVVGDLFMKVTGTDTDKIGLCYIKEEVIPSMVSESTVQNLDEILSRVKALEKSDAPRAKALRHAGEIVKSSELEEAKFVVEEGKKAETIGS